MSDHKLYQLALTFSKGIGSSTLKSLISYCGSAQKVFTTTRGRLEKIPGIGKQASANILNNKLALIKAEETLEYCHKNNVNLFFYTDKDYPDYLKQLHDSPAMIYLKGEKIPKSRRYISIVGTRNATKEGKQNVISIIKELAPYNPIIISGLAYGIDIEAHKAALENQLSTYGVMASGIDRVYPSIHDKIAHKMVENGGILTEYAPFTKMIPARFPARNRIIAGLSEATLVIEAGSKGGALITAYLARDYDREVFALPGNLNNELAVGCNNIIKNNVAQLVSSAEDIAYYLGWEMLEKEPVKNKIDFKGTKEELKVIELLRECELHIDEISWKTQLNMGKLATILLNLEFSNIVVSLPGKKYKIR
jgi:DNA processing protein